MRHALTVALGLVVAGMLATGASAGHAFKDAIHDEDSFVIEDYCETAGLDVELSYVLDLRMNVVQHGDGYSYFLQHGKQSETIRNLANGKVVTTQSTVTEKDKQITDNGDGTLTVVVLATGNAVLYGPNGKAIARNPGQLRFELLIDQMGTPDNPFDDEIIDRGDVVKGSTGRSDDACTAAVPALS